MRMTEAQRATLLMINRDGAVLWPRSSATVVSPYGTGGDGRTHFEAPVDTCFVLLDAKLIDKRGVITDAGRAALAQSEEKK